MPAWPEALISSTCQNKLQIQNYKITKLLNNKICLNKPPNLSSEFCFATAVCRAARPQSGNLGTSRLAQAVSRAAVVHQDAMILARAPRASAPIRGPAPQTPRLHILKLHILVTDNFQASKKLVARRVSKGRNELVLFPRSRAGLPFLWRKKR